MYDRHTETCALKVTYRMLGFDCKNCELQVCFEYAKFRTVTQNMHYAIHIHSNTIIKYAPKTWKHNVFTMQSKPSLWYSNSTYLTR